MHFRHTITEKLEIVCKKIDMPSEIFQTTPTYPNHVNYITLEILTFTREEKGKEVTLSRKNNKGKEQERTR